jgi:guanylate kinase
MIVVSAPSGTGKSTVLKRLLTSVGSIRFSVSHTTRTPRPGERDGASYHFVDRAAFEGLVAAGRFLEWAEVHDNLYGTSRDEYEQAERDGVDLLADLDVQGARQVRERLPDALTVFILPPSFEALEGRLRGRGADPETAIQRRLARALGEARAYAEYDHVLVNDDVDECTESLRAILLASRSRVACAESRAREILGTFPG